MVYRVVDWVEYGWVADELVITLPNGDMVILNKSAAVALGALKNARTNQEEEIAKALADEFGLTPNHAVRDARAALAKLRGAGVIRPVYRLATTKEIPYKRVTRRAFVAGMAAAGLSLLGAGTALGEESASVALRAYTGADLGAVNSLGKHRIWTDSLGRSVEVPKEIRKAAPYGPYAQALLETIDPEMIVQVTARGMHVSITENVRKRADGLAEEAGSMAALSGRVLAVEAPDIILDVAVKEEMLCSSVDVQTDESGTPIVHMAVAPGEIPHAYRTLGKLLGREDRCNELADYVASIEVAIAQVRENVPEKERKRIYYGEGLDGLKTRSSGTLVDWAISQIGATNIATGLSSDESRNVEPGWLVGENPDVVVLGVERYPGDTESSDLIRSVWGSLPLSDRCAIVLSPLDPVPWLGRSPLAIQTIGLLWLAATVYPEYLGDDASCAVSETISMLYQVDYSVAETHDTINSAFSLESNGLKVIGDNFATGYDRASTGPMVEIIHAIELVSTAAYMSSGGVPQPTEGTLLNPYYLLQGFNKVFTPTIYWVKFTGAGSIRIQIVCSGSFTVSVFESAGAAAAGHTSCVYSNVGIKEIPFYGPKSYYVRITSSSTTAKTIRWNVVSSSANLPYGGHWVAADDSGSANTGSVVQALYFFPKSKAGYLLYAILADENDAYITQFLNGTIMLVEVVELIIMVIADAYTAGTISEAEAAAWEFIDSGTRRLVGLLVEEAIFPILKELALPTVLELAQVIGWVLEDGHYTLDIPNGVYIKITKDFGTGDSSYEIDWWSEPLANSPSGEIGMFFPYPEEGI